MPGDGGVFLQRHHTMESASCQPVVDCFATILTVVQNILATIWPLIKILRSLVTFHIRQSKHEMYSGCSHWYVCPFMHSYTVAGISMYLWGNVYGYPLVVHLEILFKSLILLLWQDTHMYTLQIEMHIALLDVKC